MVGCFADAVNDLMGAAGLPAIPFFRRIRLSLGERSEEERSEEERLAYYFVLKQMGYYR